MEMSINFATGPAAWRACGGAVVVAERFWIWSDCLDGMSPDAFSMLTRNDLNSGVYEFASATYGGRLFAR